MYDQFKPNILRKNGTAGEGSKQEGGWIMNDKFSPKTEYPQEKGSHRRRELGGEGEDGIRMKTQSKKTTDI